MKYVLSSRRRFAGLLAAWLLGAACVLTSASCSRRLIVPSTWEVTVEARTNRGLRYPGYTAHRYVLSALGARGLALHLAECEGAQLERTAASLDRERVVALWRRLESLDAWELENDYSGGGPWWWRVTLREGGEVHTFELRGEGPTPQGEVVRLVRGAAQARAPQEERCTPPGRLDD